MLSKCATCPLDGFVQVHPSGNLNAPLVIVGEAPGETEVEQGLPFVGKAGTDMWKVLRRHGIQRESCRVENVLMCRPPNNRDPKPEEVSACVGRLLDNLRQTRPGTVIATMGRFPTQVILGPDAQVAKQFGIPVEWEGRTVVPCYHPAAGLHQPGLMIFVQEGLKAVAEIVMGLRPRVHPVQPTVQYMVPRTTKELLGYLRQHQGFLAIDTETRVDGSIYLYSLAVLPGMACVFERTPNLVRALQTFVSESGVKVVMHNALFDMPATELYYGGVTVLDTMVMAHLLQVHPLKLKYLAYRLLGLHIPDYQTVVEPYSRRKMFEFLAWKLVDPKVQWPDRPAGTRKKPPAARAGKLMEGLASGKLKPPDVQKRWVALVDEYPALADAVGWRLPEADLTDVPNEIAYQYTALDSCATLQVCGLCC